jgi:hypothetical protein
MQMSYRAPRFTKEKYMKLTAEQMQALDRLQKAGVEYNAANRAAWDALRPCHLFPDPIDNCAIGIRTCSEQRTIAVFDNGVLAAA